MTGLRIPSSPGVAHYAVRFPSESKPGVAYETALMLNERGPAFWDCSCPSGTYRDQCKHIQAAQKQLAALRSVALFNLRRTA